MNKLNGTGPEAEPILKWKSSKPQPRHPPRSPAVDMQATLGENVAPLET